MRWALFFFWGLGILAALAAAYLGIGLLVALRFSAPDRQEGPPGRTPADVGLGYREVGFSSEDGVPLAAWWVPPADPPARGGSSRAVVLVHGRGGDKSEEHVVETAPVYARAGYGVLLLDLRGSGASGGEIRTLGYTETRDVHAALAWLEEEGFDPGTVVLHGWSMGGATVVRSAPGSGVAAVVEEAGYADLPLVVRVPSFEEGGLPTRLFAPGAFLAAKLFLDFDPREVRPVEDAARLQEEGVPLFVIHSADDEVIPFEHASLFVEAYPEAQLWRLEGYGHVAAYAHPEYEKRLLDFLESAGSLSGPL